jgi:transposase InsO family protein
VIGWRLSNTFNGSFCLEMLEDALRAGKLEVFNTDQGVQLTAAAFTGRLESSGVASSHAPGCPVGRLEDRTRSPGTRVRLRRRLVPLLFQRGLS